MVSFFAVLLVVFCAGVGVGVMIGKQSRRREVTFWRNKATRDELAAELRGEE